MDKLLYIGGLGWILIILKVRAYLNESMGEIKGTEGFLLMMGICIIILLCAGMVLRKIVEPATEEDNFNS